MEQLYSWQNVEKVEVAPDFFSWIEPLKRGVLDEELRANFTIGGIYSMLM